MHNLNGINIGELNYDRVCLNCRHWTAHTQLSGAAKGMTCTKGQGNTNPNDSCSLFSPNRPVDGIQDPNGWNEKTNRMAVWKLNR